MRPFKRLTFSSVELLSALRSPPVAIANRLSAPARPSTLTFGVLSVAIDPSPGSCATGDVTLASAVFTARPVARDVVCPDALAGNAALHRATGITIPSTAPVVFQ